jgi:hypothetical protein
VDVDAILHIVTQHERCGFALSIHALPGQH